MEGGGRMGTPPLPFVTPQQVVTTGVQHGMGWVPREPTGQRGW